MRASKLTSGLRQFLDLQDHRNFENYRDLLVLLVQKELKVRYKNKLLGYLWSIASPLTSALVYFIAFKLVMKVNIENYPLVLISGLFPWQWFSNTVGSSTNLFIASSSLIKKVNFPRNILPLCMVLNHFIHFIVSLPIIFFFVFLYKEQVTLAWLYGIPVLMVIQLLMLYGLALIFASLNLFFRDLERLVQIALNFLFYFTPILYLPEMIPENLRGFLALNPAAPLIVAWKELFLEGRFDSMYALTSFLYAALFFVLAQAVYKSLSWRFAEAI